MAIEDDAMRLDFLKDFGVTDASFTPSGGSSSTITALLQTDYLLEDTGGEVEVETATPIITARTSDLPNIKQGDTIAISGTTYTVVEVRPDGEGMTKVRARS